MVILTVSYYFMKFTLLNIYNLKKNKTNLNL